MSTPEKKPKKPPAPKVCSCQADQVFWTCCVCRNWNALKRDKCGNCDHVRGGEPLAVRWAVSTARFK